MKIVHINDTDSFAGAGIAAKRLHYGLRDIGVDSKFVVGWKRTGDPFTIQPQGAKDKMAQKFAEQLDKIVPKFFSKSLTNQCSVAWSRGPILGMLKDLNPDIVHLHWINRGVMDIEAVAKVGKPIVWTLHDMWPFCGVEHYTESDHFKRGYNERGGIRSALDLDRWVWRRKIKSWSKVTDLAIIAPSRWMAECARDSVLFRDREIYVVPNGIDTERFKPLDRHVARQILGVPQEKKVILFGAVGATSDRRKGYYYLDGALKLLKNRVDVNNIEILIFGADKPIEKLGYSFSTNYLGKLWDELSLSVVYAAADVFVAPSLQDNLPNTVMESLACGAPVAAFDVGGMPDMIEHKVTGCLAELGNENSLADAIYWILFESKSDELSRNARLKVEKEFAFRQQAAEYLKIYETLV